MWRAAKFRLSGRRGRRFSSAIRVGQIEDEGDWFYSREWWDPESSGHTVFRSISDKGNGAVSVVAYPSSTPAAVHWPATERWLQQRYAMVQPERAHSEEFKILGYQWRVLRFNDTTRQSTVKIMAAYQQSDPGSVYFMQQPHCVAVPYVKSMVSAGLATLASCHCDFPSVVAGKKNMHILCVGHGGGSLPLFLASTIQGAIVHIVEIDPVVISASIQSMGFPASVTNRRSNSPLHPNKFDQVMWNGIHERIFLYESDAHDFVLNNETLYDLVFVDAYDGDDIFPHKLWDPQGSFLEVLKSRLDPSHGTVVVNLHADSDILSQGDQSSSSPYQVLPMGKYVSQVCKAYKDVLGGNRSGGASDEKGEGLAFAVSVPWLCNISLVVCRGEIPHSDQGVLNNLVSKSYMVEDVLNLPFSCLQYVKRGFVLI